MRTAEEIIFETEDLECPSDGWQTTYTYNDVIKLINIARKEAIEACAKEASTDSHGFVDREAILSLIEELK